MQSHSQRALAARIVRLSRWGKAAPRGWLVAVVGVFLVGSARAEEPLVLVRDGRSEATIVVPADAAPPVATAARELQEHLEKVTGALLPIQPEAEGQGRGPQIVLGPSARAQSLLPDVDLQKLGPDGIVLRRVGDSLVLAGRPPRGTLYAVYTFLEDVVGCRWWTSTESYLPKRPTLEVGSLDTVYAPKLLYREAYYNDAQEGVFAARLKCNGNACRVAPEYGGHHHFVGFVHTFYPLLPPEKYFADHPEWYSEIGGKRTSEYAQLCLTNQAMREELVRNALARLRETPDAGFLSISQNDWHGRCQCAACKAVEDEEGSPSGPLLRFVNAVAEEIEKEFPDVLVETLAYQYTRQPPKLVRPRGNVVVRLCSIECSFVQPLASDQNEKFRGDIDGWSRVAPKLFVWDYVTNFSNYILPHPNMRILATNIRYFVDRGTIGLFEQGDAQSNVGDFVRLRAWLIAHLLWNPQADQAALTTEFLQGYYGPAAPHLQAYLDTIHDAAGRSDVYLRCYMDDTTAWLPLADMNAATRHFDAAASAVAGDPVLSARVRRERLALDHAWLLCYDRYWRQARATGSEFFGPADPVAAVEAFIATAREFGVGCFREGVGFDTYEPRLRRMFRTPAPPPAEAAGRADRDWLDVQDNAFRMAREGEWAVMADDPAASDGKAIRMPGDHYEWAVSWPIDRTLAGDTWHCYAVVRSEAAATTGPAVTMGIYDPRDRKNVAYKALSVEESAGKEYRTIDLGSHALRDEMYFWAAPPKRPGEVSAVFVDRVYLVREPAKP